MIRISFIAFLSILTFESQAQSDWTFSESTYINGTISGTVSNGYVFKTRSNNFYLVNDRSRQRVRTRNPEVTVLNQGKYYKLIIADFYDPVICAKLRDVIESQIDGGFNGWEGETIFKMMNGDIWQQSSYDYMYQYSYSPEVLVYEYNGTFYLKVEEVDETIEVKKIKSSASSSSNESVSVIESQIDGDFEGWEGETVFKLMNGQIWQQTSYEYMYHYAYSPAVLIYKSGKGFVMKVEGVEETIMVMQLK